jgi:sec-independent protein translocase protein TatB
LKRSFNAIKQEVEREIGADEIRRQLHNEHILSLEQEARKMFSPTQQEPTPVEHVGAQTIHAPAAATEPAPAPAPVFAMEQPAPAASATPVEPVAPAVAPTAPAPHDPTLPPRAP